MASATNSGARKDSSSSTSMPSVIALLFAPWKSDVLQAGEPVREQPRVGRPEPRMRHHRRTVRGVDDLDGLLLRRTVARHVGEPPFADIPGERVIQAFGVPLLDQHARDVRTRHDLPARVAAHLVHGDGQAKRRQALHHPGVALLPPRADAREKPGEARCVGVDAESQHVELPVARARIDGQLDAGKPHPANAERTAGGEETRAAVRVVVVGERHHREGTSPLGQFLRRAGAVRRRAVDMQVDHFFTISVIAWRNSLTSAKRR